MSGTAGWTTPEDVRAQVRRLWDRGELLAELMAGVDGVDPADDGERAGPRFPRRLRFKGPTSAELNDRFDEARAWVQAILATPHVRVVTREIRHRVRGVNDVPSQVWVDTVDDALAIVGATSKAARFAEIVELTRSRRPALLPWLTNRPLVALQHADDWSTLLDLVEWLELHPKPDVYLRQIDVPGVDTKFVEANRRLLTELFDTAVPTAVVDPTATGVSGFTARFGFRAEPVLIRFRLLDPTTRLFDEGSLAVPEAAPDADRLDVTVDAATFGRLRLDVDRVFITENKTNFLAFPPAARSVIVFGAGFGFERFEAAAWLRATDVVYWGDIDTHGFAILDQLRGHLPHARSFLMDRRTLLAFERFWGTEPNPETRPLHRLTEPEADLYDELRANRLGNNVRLEQERIGYRWLLATLANQATVCDLPGQEMR